MKSRVLSTFALAALAFGATATFGGVAKERNAPIDERALKGQGAIVVRPSLVAPEDTVNYNGTITGEPTWTRPFADCTGATGLGPMEFQVQQFSVTVTGAYDVTSVQTGGWDGYLFVYQIAFDPNNPNTNCVIGNDDGGGGIGTSDIRGVALTAGTQYFVVTTAFENGETGAFTNTISGPGTIVLGTGGPAVVVTKTTAGVGINGWFDYEFTVTNNGPGADTGIVVSDTLPAQVTYVSDDCGGGAAGQNWTWNVGGLADGASATCTLTVNSTLTTCSAVSNTATLTADGGAISSSTVDNLTEAIQDGGFEDGTPNSFWTEASTNFGTPICDVGGCGVGGGTGPHSGTFWTWFGGIAGAEEGSMTQSVTMPSGGSASLTFWFEAPTCDAGSGADDFMEITVDATQVYRVDATSPLCNVVGYTQQSVDLSAYADGGSHSIAFHSITSGQIVNFFVDDVSIAATTCVPGGGPPPPPPAEVPTLGSVGFVALAGLLAAAGFVALRRRTA